MRKQIEERAGRAIAEHVFPGCVVGFVERGKERQVLPYGRFTYEPNSEEVAEHTLYDLASITKSIPTASLILLFVEKGWMKLSDKAVLYLPALRNHYDATVEDLLRYRVRGVQLSKLQHQTLEEIRAHALETGFTGSPGESIYTNLPAFLLGRIIEHVGNAQLQRLAHKYFFEPLGMQATTFFPTPSDCPPTEIDERGEVRGLPHDESAYVFAKARRAVGHAGLFSNTHDILNFLEALLAWNYTYISDSAAKGLGWQVNDQRFMGTYAQKRTFGKTGFTGTSVVCDIERGSGLVILSNRTYPSRPSIDDAIYEFRRDIANIVFEPR